MMDVFYIFAEYGIKIIPKCIIMHYLRSCFVLIFFSLFSQSYILLAQKISAGNFHAVVVCPNAVAGSWGRNDIGQFGDGTHTSASVPVLVKGLTNIIMTTCGRQHTLALKADGTVWAWGDNAFGQLGVGNVSWTDTNTAVQVLGLNQLISIAAGT